LTTLSLEIIDSPPPPVPTPTTSQLFSILSSNPNLRELELTAEALPKDADGSTFQVPLHHLKVLSLSGDPYRLFGLLRQLILPEMLDRIDLTGSYSTVKGVSQNIGPYMWEYFRRGTWFQDRLEISSYSTSSFVSVSVGVVRTEITTLAPQATLAVAIDAPLPRGGLEQLFVDLITPVPRERVVSFAADTWVKLPEELYSTMPNIESLCLKVESLKGFLQSDPRGPHANMKLFPSLQALCLKEVDMDDNEWGHLIAYLTYQTSGGQTISLDLSGYLPCIAPEMVDKVESLVREFNYRHHP